MTDDHSLITVIPVEQDGNVVIPSEFTKKMKGNCRMAIYVKSNDTIIVKMFDKKDGDKVFNAYLEVKPDDMRLAVKWIGENVPINDLIWTSGFCVPEMARQKRDCVWQGVVKFSGNPGMTIKDANVFFKTVNIVHDKVIVTRAVIDEV